MQLGGGSSSSEDPTSSSYWGRISATTRDALGAVSAVAKSMVTSHEDAEASTTGTEHHSQQHGSPSRQASGRLDEFNSSTFSGPRGAVDLSRVGSSLPASTSASPRRGGPLTPLSMPASHVAQRMARSSTLRSQQQYFQQAGSTTATPSGFPAAPPPAAAAAAGASPYTVGTAANSTIVPPAGGTNITYNFFYMSPMQVSQPPGAEALGMAPATSLYRRSTAMVRRAGATDLSIAGPAAARGTALVAMGPEETFVDPSVSAITFASAGPDQSSLWMPRVTTGGATGNLDATQLRTDTSNTSALPVAPAAQGAKRFGGSVAPVVAHTVTTAAATAPAAAPGLGERRPAASLEGGQPARRAPRAEVPPATAAPTSTTAQAAPPAVVPDAKAPAKAPPAVPAFGKKAAFGNAGKPGNYQVEFDDDGFASNAGSDDDKNDATKPGAEKKGFPNPFAGAKAPPNPFAGKKPSEAPANPFVAKKAADAPPSAPANPFAAKKAADAPPSAPANPFVSKKAADVPKPSVTPSAPTPKETAKSPTSIGNPFAKAGDQPAPVKGFSAPSSNPFASVQAPQKENPFAKKADAPPNPFASSKASPFAKP